MCYYLNLFSINDCRVGTKVKPMAKAKISTHKGTAEEIFCPAHVTVYASDLSDIVQRNIMEKVNLLVERNILEKLTLFFFGLYITIVTILFLLPS